MTGHLDAAQRVNWSNFPLGGPGANRAGVRWGNMVEMQRAELQGPARQRSQCRSAVDKIVHRHARWYGSG